MLGWPYVNVVGLILSISYKIESGNRLRWVENMILQNCMRWDYVSCQITRWDDYVIIIASSLKYKLWQVWWLIWVWVYLERKWKTSKTSMGDDGGKPIDLLIKTFKLFKRLIEKN